jgi:hypothetical protein
VARTSLRDSTQLAQRSGGHHNKIVAAACVVCGVRKSSQSVLQAVIGEVMGRPRWTRLDDEVVDIFVLIVANVDIASIVVIASRPRDLTVQYIAIRNEDMRQELVQPEPQSMATLVLIRAEFCPVFRNVEWAP